MAEYAEPIEPDADPGVSVTTSSLECERLALAAHEVKNGLNVVSLAAHQLAGLKVDDETAAKLKRIADMLMRASRRVTDTMRDLVDLTRLEAGTMRAEARPFDISGALVDAADRARSLIDERKLRLEISCPSIILVGDRERTGVVLDVLLSNAIRFTPKGGVIHIESQRHGGELVLSIRDEGPGIDADRLAKLFERPLPRRGDPSSLGRGLPLAKGLVETQGGRIGVDSVSGQGATFWFSLPTATT